MSERNKSPEQSLAEFNDKVSKKERAALNPQTRTPIIVCIDTSFSMRTYDRTERKSRLELVRDGLRNFCRTLENDPHARSSVELCVIAYGNDRVRVVQDFAYVNEVDIPELAAVGNTPLVDAVEFACGVLDRKLEDYQGIGTSNHLPLILLIGDGGTSEDEKRISRAAAEVKRRVRERRLAIRGVIIDSLTEDKDDKLLRTLTGGETTSLEAINIPRFFAWLSRDALRTSRSVDRDQQYYQLPRVWVDFHKEYKEQGGK